MPYRTVLLRKARALMERLSSRPPLGGLQVSDSGFYYALAGGDERARMLRIPPGVIREGIIEDREQFHELLLQFRELVGGDDRTRLLPVVLTLPAALVYTQSFSVPNVSAAKLNEVALLNLQMVSPLPAETAYLGWQLIREIADRYELLGAVAERRAVDAIREAVEAARFSPIAVEFPSLSLARIVGRLYRTSPHPLLVLLLSSDGLNLFIYWNGALYFDYFRSWRSMQGEAREISEERFREIIAQETQKVLHFALSRFQETPGEVFLIAPGFEAELETFLTERFGLRVLRFELAGWSLTPVWYPAIGASLRAAEDRSRDTTISLAPVSSADIFYHEQLIDFIRLWRGIAVATLSLFLVFFALSSSLLGNQVRSLHSQLDLFSAARQPAELASLRAIAERFNTLVRVVSDVRRSPNPAPAAFAMMTMQTARHGVILHSFTFSGFAALASLVGDAPGYDAMVAFKNAVAALPGVGAVDLPLARVVQRDDGGVTFTLSFRLEEQAVVFP